MKKGEKLAKVGECVYVHDKESPFFGWTGEVTKVFWPKEQEYHVKWLTGPRAGKGWWLWCNQASRVQEIGNDRRIT